MKKEKKNKEKKRENGEIFENTDEYKEIGEGEGR